MELDKKNERLTTGQALFLFIGSMMGSELMTLPREVAQTGKVPDVWISIIISGLFYAFISWIMVKLAECYPQQTFYEFIQRLIGSWAGKAIGLLLVIYFLVFAGFELRSVNEVTSFLLLEGTPTWAISSVFLWLSLYMCAGGLFAIGKMCQVVVPIFLCALTVICLIGLFLFDSNYLRPVLSEGAMPVIRTLRTTLFSFSGHECLLFILYQMEKPREGRKVVGYGIGITLFFYVASVIVSIGAFSVKGVVTRTWPFVDVIRGVELSFLFLERLESLLLSIWIMQVFITFSICYYLAALGVSKVLRLPIAAALFILLPLVFLLSLLPKGISDLFAVGQLLGLVSFLFFSIASVLLLLIAKARSWRHG
ncbi:GerAB/ArcD/ProY family transporter [Gorillibacterium sp. CAU 1737]|uniref:GerAB/ArcD/ProY family transporter n=1 Tax=Gorillibacterium sp. CAU 1737 TaxID=3140362 RepID=UPI003261D337